MSGFKVSIFKTTTLAVAILGSFAAMPAQAAPVASAESVVSFENFTLSWNVLGRQVDRADFSSLSVTSSQLTAAAMTGQIGSPITARRSTVVTSTRTLQ